MRVAIIPARGGSVRIPRKNIRPFHGKPMLLHPIEAARKSVLFDLIVVSTDDAEIAAVAFQAGTTVMPRPSDDGETGTQEIAARVLDALDVRGEACVIYPCSPLLSGRLLLDSHMESRGRSFTYSVTPQGADAGCFYWGRAEAFRGRLPLAFGHKFRLPPDRAIDINTPDDWSRAESMFEALRRAQ